MDLHPPPLWTPTRPAIIRAHQVPRTPAEARGIRHSSEDAFACVGRPLGGKATRFRFISFTTSGADTIVVPAVRKDDVGVLVQFARQPTSLPTQVTPAGFTPVVSATGSYSSGTTFGVRASIAYKKFVAADAGTTLTGLTSTFENRKMLAVFRPNGKLPGITHQGVNNQFSATAPTLQTITAASYAVPSIVIAHWNVSGSGDPTGTLPTSGLAAGTYSGSTVFYELMSSTPANRTIGMPDTGDYTILQSFVLVITP